MMPRPKTAASARIPIITITNSTSAILPSFAASVEDVTHCAVDLDTTLVSLCSKVRAIFHEEVETMRRFESPNILRMFGISVQDGERPESQDFRRGFLFFEH